MQIPKHRVALADLTVLQPPILFLLWLITDKSMGLVRQKMSCGYYMVFGKDVTHFVQWLCLMLAVSWGKHWASISLSFFIYKMGTGCLPLCVKYLYQYASAVLLFLQPSMTFNYTVDRLCYLADCASVSHSLLHNAFFKCPTKLMLPLTYSCF